MEYENVDEEVVYKKACENVKKIAKAIKAIRIKYYPNFSRISEEDEKTYKELENEMMEISKTHNLGNLELALMAEIEAKYDIEKGQEDKINKKSGDSFLLAYQGAIDAEVAALAEGKIKKAMKCQSIRKQYEGFANGRILETLIEYKRNKFAELSQTRQKTENNNEKWKKILEGFNTKTTAQTKKSIVELFKEKAERGITVESDRKEALFENKTNEEWMFK